MKKIECELCVCKCSSLCKKGDRKEFKKCICPLHWITHKEYIKEMKKREMDIVLKKSKKISSK
jgi:hypothetical protein